MMKNLFASLFVMLFALLMTACAPLSKESYLECYEQFINEVAEQSGNYSEKDWEKSKEQFARYSEEWYQKFEQQLTPREKMRLAGYALKYGYYYACSRASSAKDVMREMLNEVDVEQIKSEVHEYIENDLSKDVQQFYDEAVKMSGEAAAAIDEICKEVQSGMEALSDEVDARE